MYDALKIHTCILMIFQNFYMKFSTFCTRGSLIFQNVDPKNAKRSSED